MNQDTPLPSFYNNTCVRRGRDSYEYLAIGFGPPEECLPHTVEIKRYCVPGRVWTYAFQYVPAPCAGVGGRISYGSEGTTPMGKALALVVHDLDRPQVVELFLNAFRARGILSVYGRNAETLLHAIAPRSRVCRELHKLIKP